MKFFCFQCKWGVSFIDIYKSVNNVNAKYFLREFLDIFPFTCDYIVSIVHLHIKTSSGSYSKSINLICDDIHFTCVCWIRASLQISREKIISLRIRTLDSSLDSELWVVFFIIILFLLCFIYLFACLFPNKIPKPPNSYKKSCFFKTIWN